MISRDRYVRGTEYLAKLVNVLQQLQLDRTYIFINGKEHKGFTGITEREDNGQIHSGGPRSHRD